jgi:hypothetical protein
MAVLNVVLNSSNMWAEKAPDRRAVIRTILSVPGDSQ